MAAVTKRAYFAEGIFAEGRGPRKDLICRGPIFAEGRTLGKGLFAEGRSLPRAPVSGPRQRVSLPSARYLALGKASGPRQSTCFQ